MAIHHDENQGKISLKEFFALLESDPEHRYELIDGYPYMMTGGSPDHRCKFDWHLQRAVTQTTMHRV